MIYEPCPENGDIGYDPNDICCIESLPGYNPFDELCPVRVSVSDEYFSVDGVVLDIAIDPIEINISTDDIDPISETIEVVLSDIVGEDISSGCIPLDLFESTSETITLDPLSLAPYEQFSALQVQYLDSINSILLDIPNIPHESTPDGKNESENVVLRTVGKITSSNKVDHIDLTTKIDTDLAAKLAGSRFAVLKGSLAKLQRALISLMLDTAQKNGYEEYYCLLYTSDAADE